MRPVNLLIYQLVKWAVVIYGSDILKYPTHLSIFTCIIVSKRSYELTIVLNVHARELHVEVFERQLDDVSSECFCIISHRQR
jgi:hypothetical protein